MIILLSKKSTTECVEIAEKICNKYPEKVYIHYQKLSFVGGACREGFELAKGSHVILMSTDLETDPHLVTHGSDPMNTQSISGWKNSGLLHWEKPDTVATAGYIWYAWNYTGISVPFEN